MKKIKSIMMLAFALFMQSSLVFAEDSAKCSFDGKEHALKLKWESSSNPEYTMETDLPFGVKAVLNKKYEVYGMDTFFWEIISPNGIIGKSKLRVLSTIPDSQTYAELFSTAFELEADFVSENKVYHIRCELMHKFGD